MATTSTERRYMPEDLLTLPDGEHFELVDGRLVETDMGAEASWIANRVGMLVTRFADEHKLGEVFNAECGYQCFPDDPARVRKPDVSFIARERLAGGIPAGHIRTAPDLAVEVVSPNDLFYEVLSKVEEYLRAGVRMVWVVDPSTRSVQVSRADGSWVRLRADEDLHGEEVLSGFVCRVSDLFLPCPESDLR